MFDLKACRGCLATTGRLDKLSQASKRIFTALTGLEIKQDNVFPMYFCAECRAYLKKAMIFTRRAKRAYFVLQEILMVKKQITQRQLENVDRKKTNLTSFITAWDPTKIRCYSFQEIETDDKDYQELDTIDKEKLVSAEINQSNEYKLVASEYGAVNVVDIKSADIIEVDSGSKNFGSEANLDEEPENDNQDFENENDNNIPEDIDMEDLFKDLKDEHLDDEIEEIAPDIFEEAFNVRPYVHKKKKRENNKRIVVLKNILSKVNIKVMDMEGQIMNFKKRCELPKFSKAIFKCFVCVMHFEDKKQVMDHLLEHNEKRAKFKNMCKICKNMFETSHDLMRHTAEEHLYEYTCKLCREHTYSINDLIEHFNIHKDRNAESVVEDIRIKYRLKLLKPEEMVLTVTPNQDVEESGIYFCTKCSVGLSSKYALKHSLRHVEPLKKGRAKMQCDHCKLWFGTMTSLKNHMDMYHCYKYRCRKCKVVAYSQRQALAHRKKHMPKVKKIYEYKCSMCKHRSHSAQELTTHNVKVHNVRSTCHCNVCGDCFLTFNLLLGHQLRNHEYLSVADPLIGDPNFTCKHCNVRFVSKRALDNHHIKMDHEEAKTIDTACLTCKELFETVEKRKYHQCAKETNYPAPCPYCAEMLPTYLSYRGHIFKEHPGQKFKPVNDVGYTLCEICGESVNVCKLSKHMQRHEGISLPCPYCPFKFDTPTLCAIHVISNHQHNPYICAVCDRRFKTRSTCRDHILKVHSTINYYPCVTCGLKFQHFDFVIEHAKNMHKIDLSKLKGRSNINRFKMYIYPDMKLDVSLLPDDVLSKVQGELVDYFDETKTEPVNNIQDYFVKKKLPDDELVVKMKGRKCKVRKKELKEDTTEVKLNDECSVMEKDGVQYVVVGGTKYKVEF